jgi:predicted RNase H-like HicB family nuclease
MYRVGLPFWKIAARLGLPMKIRVIAVHDVEAGVFVAHSPDLRGLIAEADTLELLEKEVKASAYELLSMQLDDKSLRNTKSELTLYDALLPA